MSLTDTEQIATLAGRAAKFNIHGATEAADFARAFAVNLGLINTEIEMFLARFLDAYRR